MRHLVLASLGFLAVACSADPTDEGSVELDPSSDKADGRGHAALTFDLRGNGRPQMVWFECRERAFCDAKIELDADGTSAHLYAKAWFAAHPEAPVMYATAYAVFSATPDGDALGEPVYVLIHARRDAAARDGFTVLNTHALSIGGAVHEEGTYELKGMAKDQQVELTVWPMLTTVPDMPRNSVLYVAASWT